MKQEVTEIQINGVTYVQKGADVPLYATDDSEGREYVIIRTQNAGVFAGYLDADDYSGADRTAVLYNSRRIWFWAGANSLSELATAGTSKPSECKFPAAVGKHELTQVIEVLYCTAVAQKSIESVKVWRQ